MGASRTLSIWVIDMPPTITFAWILVEIVAGIAKKSGLLGWFATALHLTIQDEEIQLAASAEVPQEAMAAPSKLKNTIIDFLNKLIEDSKLGVVPKLVLKRTVSLLPLVLDNVWDSLFTQGKVGVAHAEHPETHAVYASHRDEILGEGLPTQEFLDAIKI